MAPSREGESPRGSEHVELFPPGVARRPSCPQQTAQFTQSRHWQITFGVLISWTVCVHYITASMRAPEAENRNACAVSGSSQPSPKPHQPTSQLTACAHGILCAALARTRSVSGSSAAVSTSVEKPQYDVRKPDSRQRWALSLVCQRASPRARRLRSGGRGTMDLAPADLSVK